MTTIVDKASKRRILAGLAAGVPQGGPLQVHVDVTNACNAACITCWDHSPLLKVARSTAWKKRSMAFERFERILGQLDAFGSVRAVVLSGMGDPLVHPRIHDMMAAVKARGWHLTVLSNLLAADADRLAESGIDNLLVGVHGCTPDAYTAFHPGWTEQHFFRLCRSLRTLSEAGVPMRHVHVVNRDTAADLPLAPGFARRFGAGRVNAKLASLAGGTEACAITEDQRAWLLEEGVPRTRAEAARHGVDHNLDLFEAQLRAGGLVTTDMDAVGCAMGFVYTRITVDEDVLYCCNTELTVGSLRESTLGDLWFGDRWQQLRDRFARHDWAPGCERCGKYEQNVKWMRRLRAETA